jgi:hypothetical protein
MENNMSKIVNFTDGYYYFLFRGSKMVPSISNGNCYWEIMYIKVVKEGTTELVGQRKLTPGVWVCGVGSVNWTRIDNIQCITVTPLTLPDLPDNHYVVEKIDLMQSIKESIKGNNE